MARVTLHPVDVVLDAVRDLVVEDGPRAASIRAIAERSGAPSGSLYHRFRSRDELVARAWLRAAHRFQAGFLAALDGTSDGVPHTPTSPRETTNTTSTANATSDPGDPGDPGDPRDAAVNAVRWGVEFFHSQPADARLLLSHSRRTLLDGEPDGPIAEALATVNRPLTEAVRRLAVRLYRTDTPEAVERVTYAVIDLPLAVLRRHATAGQLSDATARTLEPAIRALLTDDDPLDPPRSTP